MSNGLTFELYNILHKIFGIEAKWLENGVTEFHKNHLRIDWVDTEKLTFILDQAPLFDGL